MPNQTTHLASDLINGHDRLTIELVEPPDMPAAILLRWPQKPSVTTQTPTATWPRRACRCCQRRLSSWRPLGGGGAYKNHKIRTPGPKFSAPGVLSLVHAL